MSAFLEWVAEMLHAAEPDLPMGEIYNAVDWTGAIIPELVSGTSTASIFEVPEDVDRRDTPSDEEVLPMNVTYSNTDVNGVRYYTVEGFPGVFTSLQVFTNWGIVVDETAALIDPGGDDGMGWYSDIDEQFFGGMLPGGAPPGTGGFPTFPGYGFTDVTAPANGNGTTPAVPPPTAMMGNCGVAEDPMKGCVLKKVCGTWRWIKQKKGRRKQLVTKSDAQGLAVLKGLVGVGKTMDTWIATHS